MKCRLLTTFEDDQWMDENQMIMGGEADEEQGQPRGCFRCLQWKIIGTKRMGKGCIVQYAQRICRRRG